jgi:hypothetical protein
MTQPVETLPRDFAKNGRTFTQLFRSHSGGGRIVYLRNSLPGQATGHKLFVFAIDIVNGKEVLGHEIASPSTLMHAIDIASKE